MTYNAIGESITRAAGSVVLQWPDVISQDDLESELWTWVLARASVKDKLSESDSRERHKLLVRHGHILASEAREKNLRFAAEFEYSIDDARAVLTGVDRRHESLDDLTEAMDLLRGKNLAQADKIAKKYGYGEPMGSDAERKMLRRAEESLTTLMNQIAREKLSRFSETPGKTLGGGPGSRQAVSNQAAQMSLNRQDAK
ncbi:hypothetical protein ACWCPQ_14395 [Nocardia sp. NPDC001965]